MYVFIFLVKVTEWPPIGKIAAHSAYDMFSWYKYLMVSLVFSHLGFWSGNLFLVAPFPDLCLLVPFSSQNSFRYVEFQAFVRVPAKEWRATEKYMVCLDKFIIRGFMCDENNFTRNLSLYNNFYD